MKKFFSLVLALVMALSLTTVAWGAEALPAPDASGVITLAANTAYDKITDVTGVTKIVGASGATVAGVKLTSAVNGLTFEDVTFTGDVGVDNDVDGLTFDGCVFKKDAGMYIISNYGPTFPYTAQNVTVTGCYFEDAGNGDAFLASATDETAILITHATGNVTVTNNIIDGADWNGIQVGGSGAFVITGNTISNTGSRSMRVVSDGSSLTVKDNIVSNANQLPAELAANTTSEGKVEAIKATGSAVATATLTGNTYNGEAVVLAGGMAYVPVAKVGNTTYATVADAVATANGAPVVLLDTSATIPAGYTVATDVNGNLVVLAGTNVPASSAKGAYYTTDMTNLAVYPACDLATYNYTLENYTSAADAAKTFAQVAIWQTNKVNGAKTIALTGVVANADSANVAFVNGSSITYLNTNVNTWTAKATAVTTVEVDDAEKCGDVFATGDVAVYTDANGVVYVEDITGAAYNVNGKLVMLKAANEVEVTVAGLKTLTPVAGTVYTVKHTYAADTKTAAGKTEITKVSCSVCKKSFAFVVGTPAQAIAKFGVGNYVTETLATKTVYIAADYTAPAVGGTTSSTVQSAQTFDAGIAMYVGMSVMAAAGSAVVIGKKKD